MSVIGQEGARQIYPSSTVNPQYFILGRSPNSIKGGNISGSGPWHFGGGQQRANVVAQGAGSGHGLADHGRALSQGYMNSPKDWRNIEMSLGIIDWNGNDGITQYCRGGQHTGSHGCEGFAYKGTLYNSGRCRMAKESYHVQYDYWADSNTQGGSNMGFKFICFDNGQFVTLEIWCDPGNQNNWKMIKREIDNGFGSGGSGCGGTDGGPGLWGGPFATLRSDVDDIDFSYFSVREINPFGTFLGNGIPTNPSSPTNTGPGTNPEQPEAAPGDSGSGGGFPGNMGGNVQSDNLGTGYTAVAKAGSRIVASGPSGTYTGGGMQGGGEGGGFVEPDSTTTPVSQVGDITESPLITIFKDFYDRYDLIAVSGNACGVGTYNEAKDLIELFRGATSPNYLKMSETGYDAIQVGQKVVTAQSQLFNKVPRRLEAVFKKFGSPTGQIFCRVRDKKGILKQELGTFEAAAVGLNDTDVEFQNDDAEYKLQIGDIIWVEYSADGDGTTAYLLYKRGDQDAADAFNSWFAFYDSTTKEDQLNDLAASIYE